MKYILIHYSCQDGSKKRTQRKASFSTVTFFSVQVFKLSTIWQFFLNIQYEYEQRYIVHDQERLIYCHYRDED